jgi:hypothetical protein
LVKITEPLINVVTINKPKRLSSLERDHRLEPKGKGSGLGVYSSPSTDVASPANRRNLTHLNQVLARNVVSRSVSLWESEPQGTPMGWSVEDAGESEGPFVMKGIQVALVGSNITSRESGLTSSWCLITRKLE